MTAWNAGKASSCSCAKLAERSRELRKEEFIQMQKDRVIIHTGHLAGRLLAEVLLADLMENTEVMQPQALPAAA